jgi:ParB family chromosome partitioning protein
MAGLLEVPVLVREGDPGESERLVLALVENLQRSDLDPVDEARGYHVLNRVHGLTQEDIARRVGRDRTTVANLMRLLKAPPRVLKALSERRIDTGHAKALLAVEDSSRCLELLDETQRDGLSVRELERRVRRLGKLSGARPRTEGPWPSLEDSLTREIGAKVEIRRRNDGGGRLLVHFGSTEELTAIVDRLQGHPPSTNPWSDDGLLP